MSKFKIGLIAAFFCVGGMILNGCRIQMTAQERINAAGRQGTQEIVEDESAKDIAIQEPEKQKASVLTVSYQPYSLKKLASVFWGMSENDVDSKKEDDVTLFTGTQEDMEYYGKYETPHIMVVDGGTAAWIYGENDAGIYNTLIGNSNGGEWYTYSNENLSKHFERINEKEDVQNEAGILIEDLKQLGIDIASWDCYYLSKEVLEESQMPAPGYERDEHGDLLEGTVSDWTEQDETYCFLFRMAFMETGIEDINGESLIKIIYSPVRNSIVYASLGKPAYLMETVSKGEEMDVMSSDEVMVFAKKILQETSPSASITNLCISYVVTWGSSDFRSHITQLTPVWKVSYDITTGSGQTATDYLLLDAATGAQYRDSDLLF